MDKHNIKEKNERAVKIQVRELCKTFKTELGKEIEAICDVTIDIYDREFVSIIGPSGCGKTTFLTLIAGLITPTKGSISVDNKEVKGTGRDRGVIFQQDAIFPWRKVADNVGYGLEIAGMSKEERMKVIEYHLSLVGLGEFAKLYPKELSGGMKKRVAIAMVLANNPAVMLMDEPFGALDYPTKVNLQNELIKIWEKEKKTTIFVTHDIEEALFLSDRIIILVKGRVTGEFSVPFSRPREDETRFDPQFLEAKHELWKYL
jgi:NitT/TauT family transport system ATP-binding protein